MVDDAEDMTMLSAKVNPNDFVGRFSREPGPADGGSDLPPSRGSKNSLQESTLVGLRAMLQETPSKELKRKPVLKVRTESRPVPSLHEDDRKVRSSLVESGDIMQSLSFQFTVTVQEVTEDGGFIGRAPGVGRVRVRGSELSQYKRIGRGV